MDSKFLAGILLSSALVSAAHADPLLQNGSLEPNLGVYSEVAGQHLFFATPASQSDVLPGWTVTAGSIEVVNNSRWQASNGTYSVDMIGGPGLGTIQQTVHNLTAGVEYTLTFDFAVNPESPSDYLPTLWNEKGTTKRLQIEAFDGATSLHSQIYADTDNTRTALDMQYIQQTFVFTATSADITLSLSAISLLNLPTGYTAAQLYCGPVIDNLVLAPTGSATPQSNDGGSDTPIPEPASLAVLGLGALGLLSRRAAR